MTAPVVPRRARVVELFLSRAYLASLPIGQKLALGFGAMIGLTLIVVALGYLASSRATREIVRTNDLYLPAALKAAEAQADVLRMLASTRGYLALGDPEFLVSYRAQSAEVRVSLAELQGLSASFDADDRALLATITQEFAAWEALPPQRMFDLRADQMAREPAYRTLSTDGINAGGTVLLAMQRLIDLQAALPPSAETIAQLRTMARFQGTFAAMLSGLRGYVTTRNRIFRSEYESNRDVSALEWQALTSRDARGRLTADQRALLDEIAAQRALFLSYPAEMFTQLEGERWREDLYMFSQQALPIGERMTDSLQLLTDRQQSRLQRALDGGRSGLESANRQTLLTGLLALLLGSALAWVIAAQISRPVHQLTAAATRIGAGDLAARAPVGAYDEVGELATTFNGMAQQIQQNVVQIRREKRRADDLLGVVIPIGVQLSAEHDFDRLLELMLVEAKAFCGARAGSIFLATDDELRCVILRDDAHDRRVGGTSGAAVDVAPITLHPAAGVPDAHGAVVYAAIHGLTVNLPDATPSGLPGDGYDASLIVPLKSSTGEVRGILQLHDPIDPERGIIGRFAASLQQMMESFSSPAVAALDAYRREQALRQEIRQLTIVIDENKRRQEVDQIVDSDFFQSLQSRGRSLRMRRAGGSAGGSADDPPAGGA